MLDLWYFFWNLFIQPCLATSESSLASRLPAGARAPARPICRAGAYRKKRDIIACINMCIYIYIYTNIYYILTSLYIYIYIYIHIEGEREYSLRGLKRLGLSPPLDWSTHGYDSCGGLYRGRAACWPARPDAAGSQNNLGGAGFSALRPKVII